MSGTRKRKHREARPHAWDLPGGQQLHQRFCNKDPPQITHSAVEVIRRSSEGSLSRDKNQNSTIPTNPRVMQRSHTASLLELLHAPSSDESCRNVPLTRHSGLQRVVRIPIDRPDSGKASPGNVGVKTHEVTFNKKHKVAKQSKSASFPEKLYAILEEPDLADVIAWTPHGTSWRVLQTTYLQEFVLPRYFRSERYTSFMRQVRNNPSKAVLCWK
jgi:HSF-type DNA-binding